MNNIQNLRVRKKLTQEQLATILKIDRSTIAKWETGEAMPRADKLPEIAKALDCTIDDLFKEVDENV